MWHNDPWHLIGYEEEHRARIDCRTLGRILRVWRGKVRAINLCSKSLLCSQETGTGFDTHTELGLTWCVHTLQSINRSAGVYFQVYIALSEIIDSPLVFYEGLISLWPFSPPYAKQFMEASEFLVKRSFIFSLAFHWFIVRQIACLRILSTSEHWPSPLNSITHHHLRTARVGPSVRAPHSTVMHLIKASNPGRVDLLENLLPYRLRRQSLWHLFRSPLTIKGCEMTILSKFKSSVRKVVWLIAYVCGQIWPMSFPENPNLLLSISSC